MGGYLAGIEAHLIPGRTGVPRPPVGSYSRTMPRLQGGSYEGGRFLMFLMTTLSYERGTPGQEGPAASFLVRWCFVLN